MALSKGNSTESNYKRKLYTGIDKFKVLGVNPDLETLHGWGMNIKNAPEYVKVDEDGTKRVDIVVWVKSVTIPDFITHVDFTLRNKKNESNKDGVHKTQMIDRFGNTSWLTDEEVKNKVKHGKPQPFYPAEMRPARRGEAQLTEFFKFFTNVEDSHRYKDGQWVMSDTAMDNANYLFETVASFFSGDVSELAGQVASYPENSIQLLCGVQAGKDGRIFQTVYSDLCFRKSAGGLDKKFSKKIADRKSKGYLQGHEYTFDTIQEWKVATDDTDKKDEE